MDEAFSEERQLMKWVGIFQMIIFWVGIFRGVFFKGGGGVGCWVGIFRGDFSRNGKNIILYEILTEKTYT